MENSSTAVARLVPGEFDGTSIKIQRQRIAAAKDGRFSDEGRRGRCSLLSSSAVAALSRWTDRGIVS